MSEEFVNPHQPVVATPYGGGIGCSGCGYYAMTGKLAHLSEEDIAKFVQNHFREHADQYLPGRAPDITVEYELVASCSVCEDGTGNVVQDDSESVRCDDCGTTWFIDGTQGEREEVDGEE